MFSFNYLLKSVVLLITHPSSLVGSLRGSNPSMIIDKHRRAKWARIRTRFASEPKKAGGFSIFLNPNDESAVSSSIGTVGWLNLALTELFRKIVKKGMIFVDVGANIGYYTMLAAGLVGETGRVFAFEPEPESFALMLKSIEYNRFHNITAEPVFLSDKDEAAQRMRVRTITLDHLGESTRIDVIKIHTSGSEPQVLRGARELIKKHHPRIIVSYVPKLWQNDQDLLNFLKVHYEIFEVLQSPKLIRLVKPINSLEWKAVELYLVPRNSDP